MSEKHIKTKGANEDKDLNGNCASRTIIRNNYK